jgi:hypothetical protein
MKSSQRAVWTSVAHDAVTLCSGRSRDRCKGLEEELVSMRVQWQQDRARALETDQEGAVTIRSLQQEVRAVVWTAGYHRDDISIQQRKGVSGDVASCTSGLDVFWNTD